MKEFGWEIGFEQIRLVAIEGGLRSVCGTIERRVKDTGESSWWVTLYESQIASVIIRNQLDIAAAALCIHAGADLPLPSGVDGPQPPSASSIEQAEADRVGALLFQVFVEHRGIFGGACRRAMGRAAIKATLPTP